MGVQAPGGMDALPPRQMQPSWGGSLATWRVLDGRLHVASPDPGAAPGRTLLAGRLQLPGGFTPAVTEAAGPAENGALFCAGAGPGLKCVQGWSFTGEGNNCVILYKKNSSI